MTPTSTLAIILSLSVLLGNMACSSGDSGDSDATGGSSALGAGGASGGPSGVSGAGGGATGAGGTAGAGGAAGPLSCETGGSNCFSFFVTSRARLFALAEAFSGGTSGWGGDLRYGTGDGLAGADKICTEIAEASLPGNGRTWRAFLSTSQVDAIDRVGPGPWYDRLNRLIARDLTELVETRPGGIDNATIRNNLPNEDGTPHHNEEVGCNNLDSCADNHDVLTGSDSDGRRCTADTCSGMMGGGWGMGDFEISDYTCQDWTLGSSIEGIAPRVGHTWPTMTGMEDDWISQLTEAGCAPGYNLVQISAPIGDGNGTVGDGGGYGALYCFGLSG